MILDNLKKQKIKLSKKDKVTSNAYASIIDVTQKIAKEENREPENEDVVIACKKLIKTLQKVVDEIKEGEVIELYKKEISIYKTFLPEQVSEEKITQDITVILTSEPTAKQGEILKTLKQMYGEGIDMKMASNILKKILLTEN